MSINKINEDVDRMEKEVLFTEEAVVGVGEVAVDDHLNNYYLINNTKTITIPLKNILYSVM